MKKRKKQKQVQPSAPAQNLNVPPPLGGFWGLLSADVRITMQDGTDTLAYYNHGTGLWRGYLAGEIIDIPGGSIRCWRPLDEMVGECDG